MYPLVDFITQVKKEEYVLALAGIAVFLVFWEFLKRKPYNTVMNTGKDDMNHIRSAGGFRHIMKTIGRIAAAPFIGLAYIAILPFAFFAAVAAAVVNSLFKVTARLAGKSAAFQWRPVEAYLAGRKKKKEKKKNAESGQSDLK